MTCHPFFSPSNIHWQILGQWHICGEDHLRKVGMAYNKMVGRNGGTRVFDGIHHWYILGDYGDKMLMVAFWYFLRMYIYIYGIMMLHILWDTATKFFGSAAQKMIDMIVFTLNGWFHTPRHLLWIQWYGLQVLTHQEKIPRYPKTEEIAVEFRHRNGIGTHRILLWLWLT